jgi:hypothetical protein
MTRIELCELFISAAIGINFGIWQSSPWAGGFAFLIAAMFVKLED